MSRKACPEDAVILEALKYTIKISKKAATLERIHHYIINHSQSRGLFQSTEELQKQLNRCVKSNLIKIIFNAKSQSTCYTFYNSRFRQNKSQQPEPVKPHCAECTQSNDENEFIFCSDCNWAFHPKCVQMSPEVLSRVRKLSSWQCVVCKSCTVCHQGADITTPGTEDLLLCDACDRGFHMQCCQPPLCDIPPGQFICWLCTAAHSQPQEKSECCLFPIRDEDRVLFYHVQKQVEQTLGEKSCSSSSSSSCRTPPRIQLGAHVIETWYSSPYPSEYTSQHRTLYICEFCLCYVRSREVFLRHQAVCPNWCPPGDEIYRCKKVSIFLVDGQRCPMYCQNLCLLAKLFLNHKTLYEDVEPFHFYVATLSDESGTHLVGYFSKEKAPLQLGINLSCIMVLPPYQGMRFGRFLIDFSYLLSRREGVPGSPEKPLSALGQLSYRAYWRSKLLPYLTQALSPECSDTDATITLGQISQDTGIDTNDLADTLQTLGDFTLTEENKPVLMFQPHVLRSLMEQQQRVSQHWLQVQEDAYRPPEKPGSVDAPTSTIDDFTTEAGDLSEVETQPAYFQAVAASTTAPTWQNVALELKASISLPCSSQHDTFQLEEVTGPENTPMLQDVAPESAASSPFSPSSQHNTFPLEEVTGHGTTPTMNEVPPESAASSPFSPSSQHNTFPLEEVTGHGTTPTMNEVPPESAASSPLSSSSQHGTFQLEEVTGLGTTPMLQDVVLESAASSPLSSSSQHDTFQLEEVTGPGTTPMLQDVALESGASSPLSSSIEHDTFQLEEATGPENTPMLQDVVLESAASSPLLSSTHHNTFLLEEVTGPGTTPTMKEVALESAASSPLSSSIEHDTLQLEEATGPGTTPTMKEVALESAASSPLSSSIEHDTLQLEEATGPGTSPMLQEVAPESAAASSLSSSSKHDTFQLEEATGPENTPMLQDVAPESALPTLPCSRQQNAFHHERSCAVL